LASKIRQQLVPKLRPHGAVEIYLRTPLRRRSGILYPDVEVLRMMQSTGSGSAAVEALSNERGSVLLPPLPANAFAD